MLLTKILVDTASCSDNHYELLTIAEAISNPMQEIQIELNVTPLVNELSAIKEFMLDQKTTNDNLKAKAEEILEAHKEAAKHYTDQVDEDPQPDWYPFVELPEGTTYRDLPDGNKLFTLSDGVILRTTDKHTIVVIDAEGSKEIVPGPDTNIEVQLGRTYEIVDEWIETTQTIAGISGLPIDILPKQVASRRFSFDLQDKTKIIADHATRLITVQNPSGTLNIIGKTKVESINEQIAINVEDDGTIGFTCLESGHAGSIEIDGTIYLSLASGEDLVFTFPVLTTEDNPDSDDLPNENQETTLCQEV